MSDNQEHSFAKDAYLGIELPLQKGTHTCKPLPLVTALRYMELIERAAKGDMGATCEVIETFPKAVGLRLDDFDGMTPAEVFGAIISFFACRRRTTPAPIAPSPDLATSLASPPTT